MVSEREIEAALSAWNNYNNSGPVAEDRSDAMRVALEAAARVREEDNAGEPEETIEINGRSCRKFIPYPEEVDDGTLRCIACGQIDEQEYHDETLCPACDPAPQPSGTVEALRKTLVEAGEFVAAVFGENRPARSWAYDLRRKIDEALSALTAGGGEEDDTDWTEVSSFSATSAQYQEEFSTDGRWRHRLRSKPDDLWPQPWKPGRAPKVEE